MIGNFNFFHHIQIQKDQKFLNHDKKISGFQKYNNLSFKQKTLAKFWCNGGDYLMHEDLFLLD